MPRSTREWAGHDASMLDAARMRQEWDPEYQNYHGEQPLEWGTNPHLPGNSKYRNVPANLAYNDPKAEALLEKQIGSNIAAMYVSHPKMSQQLKQAASSPHSEKKLGFALSQIITGTRDKMMGKKLLTNDKIWAAQDGVLADTLDRAMSAIFGDNVDMNYRESVANEAVKFLQMYDEAGEKAKDQNPQDKTRGVNRAQGDQSAVGLLSAASGGFMGSGESAAPQHMYSEVVPENTARAKAEARALARKQQEQSSGGALGNLFGSLGG